MLYSQSLLDEIQNKLNLVDVISDYVSLQKKGHNYMGLCPFHQEKSPSFSVSPIKNVFHCFGCGKGGGLFQFIMEIEKVNFSEAVQMLAQKAGVEISKKTPEEEAQDTKRSALLELLRRVTGTFQHFLHGEKGRQALEVIKKRGINDHSLEKFQLGYLPADNGWLWDFLLGKKYDEDTLRLSGLFGSKGKRCLFSDRLIFPIQNHRGDIVAFGGRLLNGEGPKYINSPETPVFQKRRTLYGLFPSLANARRENRLILTEGYMDVISLHQAGAPYAVAPLGTSVTDEHLEMVRRYGLKIQFFMDADAAGLKAMWKALEQAETLEMETDLLLPADGCKDPAEILEKKGAQILLDCVEQPVACFDYLISRKFQHSGSLDAQALEASGEFFSFLKKVPSELKQDFYLKKFSEIFRIDELSLKNDFKKGKTSLRKIHNLDKEVFVIPGFEWPVVATLIAHPELYGFFRMNASSEDFLTSQVRDILYLLDKNYFSNYNSSQLSLTNALELLPKEYSADLIRRVQSGETDQHPEKVVVDGIRQLKLRTLTEKKSVLQLNLKSVKEELEMEKILNDLMYLDGEIERVRNTGHE